MNGGQSHRNEKVFARSSITLFKLEYIMCRDAGWPGGNAAH